MHNRIIHFSDNSHTKHMFSVDQIQNIFPCDSDMHSHSYAEVYYFLSGNAGFIIDGTAYYVSTGDLLLVGPRQLHQPISQSNLPGFACVRLQLDGRLLYDLGLQNDPNLYHYFQPMPPASANHLQPMPEQQEFISDLLKRMIDQSSIPHQSGSIMNLALLTVLLAEINRLIDKPVADNRSNEHTSEQLIIDVLNYINVHYAESLSLDQLAERFYVSKCHLGRLFKQNIGTTVYQYIIQRRLMAACKLMDQGNSPNDIYLQCGFCDYASFYRAFKSEYNITPREYIQYGHSVAQS